MDQANSLDWTELLSAALEVGVTPSEFWDMTPGETILLIEKRNSSRRLQTIQIAWLTAKLSRAKRVPALKSLLASKAAKPVRGKELIRRRREFSEMTRHLDSKKIVQALEGKKYA